MSKVYEGEGDLLEEEGPLGQVRAHGRVRYRVVEVQDMIRTGPNRGDVIPGLSTVTGKLSPRGHIDLRGLFDRNAKLIIRTPGAIGEPTFGHRTAT